MATLLALTVVWTGCGDAEEQANEAAEAEYAALVENQQQLDQRRQELAQLRAEAKAAAEAEPGEGEQEEAAEGEGEATGEGEPTLEERLRSAENAVREASEQFNMKIAEYLNTVDPMLEGEEPNERQAAVIRMKSGEDMVIALEYIDKGGDYSRAIRIYQDALQLDPDNEELQAALARAEENRFVSEERLAQVRNGMTKDEVRGILGQVNLRNIREYPERNVVAWFYPVDDTGAASAVWFKNNRAGELVVYKKDFNLIKGRDEEVSPE